MADIDNLTLCKKVRNFLIGPVYAHECDLNVDKNVCPVDIDRQKPIGMIQLVNKSNYEAIGDEDLRKF